MRGIVTILTSKIVNFVQEAISVWPRERNILVPVDTGIPFRDYRYLYISIHIYIYIYICIIYVSMNLLIFIFISIKLKIHIFNKLTY